MKLLYALLVVLAVGVCVGQSPEPIPIMQNKVPVPAPLKCGKYEHEEHIEGYCHSPACKGNFACPAIAVCDPPVDRCAPDLHTVTEKEWQKLMERLKRLEHPPASTTLPWPPTSAPSH